MPTFIILHIAYAQDKTNIEEKIFILKHRIDQSQPNMWTDTTQKANSNDKMDIYVNVIELYYFDFNIFLL